MEAPKVEAPKGSKAPKAEAPKVEAPKIDAVKPEAPRFPGNVMIMSPGDRVGADAKAAPAEGSSGKRRFGAMAAVVALATVAGALGGALATAGVGKLMAGDRRRLRPGIGEGQRARSLGGADRCRDRRAESQPGA